MTDRGLPIVDGAPACPFVAFEDDRDGRALAPDHRHRCFAESKPAPRALAHQEAYCLASAFPVCPAFQDWARREAAAARPGLVEAPAPRDDTPPPTPVNVPLPPRDRDPRHMAEAIRRSASSDRAFLVRRGLELARGSLWSERHRYTLGVYRSFSNDGTACPGALGASMPSRTTT